MKCCGDHHIWPNFSSFQFSRVNMKFAKCSPTLTMFFCLTNFRFFEMAKYWKNNLEIWSHWRKSDRVATYLSCFTRRCGNGKTRLGGSPGLVIMGDGSCSRGHGFESRHHLLDGHFFTFICCKNCIVCLEKIKNKWKEAGVGPFLKKWYCKTSDSQQCYLLTKS